MNDNQDSFSGLPLPENIDSAFTRISIPLIKRVYPQLIASKITSIQPLSPTSHLMADLILSNQKHMNSKWTVEFTGKIWRSLDEPWESSQIELF